MYMPKCSIWALRMEQLDERCRASRVQTHQLRPLGGAQAEEAALELQLGELQRAMHAMTEDPINRSRLYLTDEEVRAPIPWKILANPKI